MFNIQLIRKVSGSFQSVSTNSTPSDGYATIPSISAYGTFGDFTIEFWIKRGAFANSFARYIDFSFSSGFAIDRSGSTNKLDFQVLNANFISNADLVQDTWTHVACVRSGTTGFIYFNGVQDNTSSVSGSTFPYTVSTIFGIGADVTTSPGNERQSMLITDIRFWNLARSAGQINSNYQIHVDPSSSGLIGNWQFRNGSVNDSTVNNNPMTLKPNASITRDNPYH